MDITTADGTSWVSVHAIKRLRRGANAGGVARTSLARSFSGCSTDTAIMSRWNLVNVEHSTRHSLQLSELEILTTLTAAAEATNDI